MLSKEQTTRIQKAIEQANCRLILKDLKIEYKEKSGDTLWFNCPTYYHQESAPSCKLEAGKRSEFKGRWHCFGCHSSGSVVDLVKLKTQLSYWGSLAYVEERLGDEKVEKDGRAKAYPKFPKEYIKPKKSASWNQDYLKYLMGRGILWKQIKKHRIGYCDSGFYKGYVIIPVNLGIHFATWIGRSIGKQARVTSCYGGKVGLFASEFANPKNGPAIVVEGWADALHVMKLGYPNVMALQTNIVHESQFEFLKNYPYVIFMPDNDNGGLELNNSLAIYNEDHEIYMAWIRDGKDPGDAPDNDIIHALDNLKKWEVKVIKPEIEIVY